MSQRQVCRDFQRGSCRYGSNCRFYHPQPQIPNSSSASGAEKPHAYDHVCVPKDCKEAMSKDYIDSVHWKATSYSHWNCLPNDIVGDISFEEARWEAMCADQSGVPLAELISRERSYFSERVAQFKKLKDSVYRKPQRAEDWGAGTASPLPSLYAAPSQPSVPAGTTMLFGRAISTPTSTPNPSVSTGSFNHQANPFGQPLSAVSTPQTQQSAFFSAQSQTPSPSAGVTPHGGFGWGPQAPQPSGLSSATPQGPLQAPLLNAPQGSADGDIWTAECWTLGKIPEAEPPVYAR